MDQPFRLGIVGAGKITRTSHLPAALALPSVRIAGVCDADPGRARALLAGARCDAAAPATLGELLSDVDGVLIATPNHTHAPLALACLRAGVHVLVEKPLANTPAEGEEIGEAARKSGCVVAVGYCTRFFASVRLMHRLLEQGWFGALRRFAYQNGSVGGWASESGFHLDVDAAGGGVLVTTGTHFLDRMLYWFGAPERCELLDDSAGGPEANALARFWYPDFSGSARFSKTVALPAGFALETERGTVLLRDAPDAPVRLRPAELPGVESLLSARDAGAQADPFALQLEDFAAACRGEREPLVSVHDGIASLRLVSELYAQRAELACDWYGARS